MHHELTCSNAVSFYGDEPSDVLLEMGEYARSLEKDNVVTIIAISLSYICSKHFPEEEGGWDGTLVYEFGSRLTPKQQQEAQSESV